MALTLTVVGSAPRWSITLRLTGATIDPDAHEQTKRACSGRTDERPILVRDALGSRRGNRTVTMLRAAERGDRLLPAG